MCPNLQTWIPRDHDFETQLILAFSLLYLEVKKKLSQAPYPL